MDFSSFGRTSWGNDEISPYNPINSNMYDVFLHGKDVENKISNPLNIPPRKFPQEQSIKKKSLPTKKKSPPTKKEGFIANTELSDDMLIIILLVILIIVCVQIHNTVQRVFDSIQSLSVLLAAKASS